MIDTSDKSPSPFDFPPPTTQPIRIMQTQPVQAVQAEFEREPVVQAAIAQTSVTHNTTARGTSARNSSTQAVSTRTSAPQTVGTQTSAAKASGAQSQPEQDFTAQPQATQAPAVQAPGARERAAQEFGAQELVVPTQSAQTRAAWGQVPAAQSAHAQSSQTQPVAAQGDAYLDAPYAQPAHAESTHTQSAQTPSPQTLSPQTLSPQTSSPHTQSAYTQLVPTPSARHQASAHTPSVQALTAQGQPSQGITAEEASQAAAELQAFRTLETRSSRKKRNRVLRITLIVVGAVALVALAVFLIGRMLFPSDTGVQEAVTGTVEQGTYLEEITGNGVLAPFESVAVTPEIDGTIAELKVAEGDMVTAGQLLFTIDSPDLDSQIAAAQRGVDSANLNVSGAVTGRDEATRAADAAYTSYTSLKATVDWGRQAAQAAGEPFDEMAAQQQLDAAWQQYEASKSQISSAKQQVAAANLQLADAQAALDAAWKNGEKRSVYAPITGQVVTLNLERGMKLSTQASSGQAPLRIADLSKMKVTLNINELDIIKLRVDQVATVSFDAVADLTSEAKVSRISTVSAAGATAQESMGGSGGSGIVTFPVEMIIENPDSRLKIGMSAQAGIVIKRLENVLIVPALALQGDGDQVTLQVKGEDGSFAPVEVKVLERNDSTAAIEGLTAGAIKAGDEVKLEATVTTSNGQGGAMMGGSVSVGMG